MIIDSQQMNSLSGEDAELDRSFKTQLVDLASERVGGETLSCSDDFFAEMDNLLKPGRGVFIDDKYTDRGKWMDGWESRRSYGRTAPREHLKADGREFDYCVIRLGMKGVVHGVDIDTNYFKGNAPQTVSVEACNSEQQPNKEIQWQTILNETEVNAHSQNLFQISNNDCWTHLRLNMFPDGGIARFRAYGEAEVELDKLDSSELIDLSSIKNGAKALLVSDMFFSDKNNLIMPGRGINMGDGWETKRRRDPGPDWSIIKLACSGSIEKVIIDTCHFKGNFPDSFILEGAVTENDDFTQGNQQLNWVTLINKTRLFADREHQFTEEIVVDQQQNFTHVKLSIFPDGGISRMRVFGHPQLKYKNK